MRIYNGTPHNIVVIDSENVVFDASSRKNLINGDKVVLKTYPSDGVLNAKQVKTPCDNVDGVLTNKMEFESVDTLPSGYEFYIVSAMFVSACKQVGVNTSKLLTIGDPVFADAQSVRPEGILSFIQN